MTFSSQTHRTNALFSVFFSIFLLNVATLPAMADQSKNLCKKAGATMAQDNKAILIKANEAIAAGDNEGFLAICSEDTEWNFVGDITLKGKEAVRQWMATAYRQPPKFSVSEMIADRDFVVAIGSVSTTDPTGKSIDAPYCDVWRFRDGKIIELRAFVITAMAPDSASEIELSKQNIPLKD